MKFEPECFLVGEVDGPLNTGNPLVSANLDRNWFSCRALQMFVRVSVRAIRSRAWKHSRYSGAKVRVRAVPQSRDADSRVNLVVLGHHLSSSRSASLFICGNR